MNISLNTIILGLMLGLFLIYLDATFFNLYYAEGVLSNG